MLFVAMVRSAGGSSTAAARRELVHEGWSEYLDAVSRELLDAPVWIEVIGPSGPLVVEGERLALRALAYDHVDDVFELRAARCTSQLPTVLRRVVHHPASIAADSYTLLAPMTIAVEGGDGAQTVITIERVADVTA
jgi:hypothetical protein